MKILIIRRNFISGFLPLLILGTVALFQGGCAPQPPQAIPVRQPAVTDITADLLKAGSDFKESELKLSEAVEILEEKKGKPLPAAEKAKVEMQLSDARTNLEVARDAQAKISNFIFMAPAAAQANCVAVDILENIFECKANENVEMAFDYPNKNLHVTFKLNGAAAVVAKDDLIKVVIDKDKSEVFVVYNFDNSSKTWNYKFSDSSGNVFESFSVDKPSNPTTIPRKLYTFLRSKEQ